MEGISKAENGQEMTEMEHSRQNDISNFLMSGIEQTGEGTPINDKETINSNENLANIQKETFSMNSIQSLNLVELVQATVADRTVYSIEFLLKWMV